MATKKAKAVDRFGDPMPNGARLRLTSQRIRFDKKDWPDNLAISRDGTRLAARVGPLKLRVWDATTGAPLHTLTCKAHAGAGKRIEHVALSNDGGLVIACIDSNILMFDVASGEVRHDLRGALGAPIVCTPDGRSVVIPPCRREPLRLFDLASGKMRSARETKGSGEVGLSGDGRRVAMPLHDPDRGYTGIVIYDVATLECVKEVDVELGGTSMVEDLAFTGENELLVIRYSVEESTYVDLRSGTQRPFEWPKQGELYKLVVKYDATLACAARTGDDVCEVIDLRARAVLLSIPKTTHHHAAFAESRLALLGRGTIRMFDTRTWTEEGEGDSADEGEASAIKAVRFAGTTVVTYSKASTRTWSTTNGDGVSRTAPSDPPPVIAAHGITARRARESETWVAKAFRGDHELFTWKASDKITAVAVSPKEPLVAYTDWIGWLRVADATSGKARWSFQAPASKGRMLQPLADVAFSPDGSRIAAGGHGKFLMLFDTKTGDKRIALKGHAANVERVAFSPTGALLFSRDSRTTRVWNGKTGEDLGVLKGLWPDAWSEDGKLAATIELTSVVVWEPERAMSSEAAALLR